MSRKNSCNIGGSAVIEGVMMRGNSVAATAVRDSKGNIQVESERFTPFKEKNKAYKIPVLRGVLNFGLSMKDSMKYILRSSEVYATVDEEPSKFEKWLAKTFKIDLMDVVTVVSSIIGIVFALGLFVFIPQLATTAIFSGLDTSSFGMSVAYNAVAGGMRMCIFILYLWAISLLKDIKRLFMYHGAEHKTIACYEHGLDLTVENVKKMKKEHDRCGTTFMFLVMILSIFFFMLFPVDFIKGGSDVVNYILRVLLRIACIPIVAGLSYEVLKVLAKFDNVFVRILKAPGLLLQKLTTREPDDSMMECAIKAFTTVLEMEKDPTIPTTYFDTSKSVDKVKGEFTRMLGKEKEEKIELLMMDVMGLDTKTQLYDGRTVKEEEYVKIKDGVKKLKKAVPPQYVSGRADFYGRTFHVDQRVLIPRGDTEILTSEAIKVVKEKENPSVLEMCTGSGIIAITMNLETGKKIVASDISLDALDVAKQNGNTLGADVEWRQGDLFKVVKKDEKFDVIVANPPYIKKDDIKTLDDEVKNYEPHLALDGGRDGLDAYRKIRRDFESYLQEDGVMLLEIGYDQKDEIASLFDGYDVSFVKDYNNPPIDRVAIIKRNK